MSNFRKWLAKPMVWALIACLIVVATLILAARIRNSSGEQTKAKLSQNMSDAAMESGRDAAEAMATKHAGDGAIDTLTRKNADVILNAEGADAPVSDAAHDAGVLSLCRRASYHGTEQCLQFTPAQ